MHNLSHSTHTLSMLAAALLAVSIEAPLSAQWTNVSPAAGPSVRYSHAMAYDSQRGVSVLFGGRNNFANLGDTWEWDGSSWTQAASTGAPARNYHAMAYDSQRGVTVVFGGIASNGGDLGDTWEWDGSSWTEAATTGPSARYYHAMAYDSQRGVTVLFGGIDTTGELGDTWEWDGTSWTQVATTGPLPRSDHAMAYDSQRGVTVLFGGAGPSPSPSFADTWEWNGSSWTQATSTGTSPSARVVHTMAYDSARGVTVLFGGYDVSSVGDTWEWNGSSWTLAATTGPSAREVHAMVYDSQRNVTVLFGGIDSSFNNLGDTWHWLPSSPGSATTYGAGCGSPSLTFTPTTQADIGTTATALLNNAPSTVAAIAIGWSNTTYGGSSLPLDLGSMGMPGCQQLQSLNALAEVIVAGSGNVLQYDQPIPNSTIWFGVKFYTQGFCVAPGANAQGVIVSNGIQWTIGNR